MSKQNITKLFLDLGAFVALLIVKRASFHRGCHPRVAGSCVERRDCRPLAVELELDCWDYLPPFFESCKGSALQLLFELELVCQRHYDRAFWLDDLKNSCAILWNYPG